MPDRLEAHVERLVNYALYLTRNRDDANDLTHSCIVKVLAAKKVPGDEGAYRAWLFKILRNTFLDNLRKQTNHDKILQELIDSSASDGNNQPDSNVYNIEQRKINILSVRQCLEKLSTGQREILVLIDIAGFSYSEAADILQLPVGTVMSRISRSRNALLK